MKTEQNQRASVGRRRIWWLSAALPEKEVFQTERILRNGSAKPLLEEETPPFHSTTNVTGRLKEQAGCKGFSNKLQFAA